MSHNDEIKPKSRTKLWFLVHSWLAMPIWLFVFFVCLTGSIATVSQEIVWLIDPAVRANQPSDKTRILNYDEIIDVVHQASPQVYIERITRPVKSQFALSAVVSYPDSTTATVYINPYTGAIQGTASGFDFRQFIRAVHGWLLLPFDNGYTFYSFGWYIVSFLGIPMLLSLITGLVVYKRFWRGFFSPRLRFNRGSRVFWGDFHRLAGIWSIPFILIISVTGIWFLIQAALFDNSISISSDGPPIYVAREDVPSSIGDEPAMISPSDAVAVVTQAYPNVTAERVSVPGNTYNHYVVDGRSQRYPLIIERFSVNPYNGNIEKAKRLSDHTSLELVTESMRPLHTGDFVGLTLKLVYFFFGLLLTMMVFSGMTIWTKRTFKASQAIMRERSQQKKQRSHQPVLQAKGEAS
ncbi:PepSY-associated TM helix domain-containing protein [Neptunomonas phycophila]|uniref:PepSY-associated TM helix domain-containing protein n=1 Tax=Neptunomonas phycophila TaxID=1572645 RepID=A0ABT9EVQ3_9GAMM|nr:PepSY-associated TM helix domain-containing protein [Neptunomonas phycophila]MDP2522997.1 PepSY-associated TM helix domain-containing protein [Neptunomonas phycophila]